MAEMRVKGPYVLLPAVLAVLGVSAGLVGCQQPTASKKTSRDAATTVSTVPATRRTIDRAIVATGTVAAWQELSLGAQLGGLSVTEVKVKENDSVRAGDLLLKLDDRVLIAQVAQQRASVVQAEAALSTARKEAVRGESLVALKAMSQESVDTRRTAITTAQAKLDAANASLNQLRAQLDQTVVRAPVDGIISAEPVRLGTVPQSGAELVRLVRESRLEVQTRVPERDVGALKAGMVAAVAGPNGFTVMGHVRDISAKVDSSSRLATVYVSLPANALLRQGMFATVTVTAAARDSLVVPEQALVWSGGRTTVFAIDAEGRARARVVSTGDRHDGRVVVEHGLVGDEQVVVAGAGFLRDGDAVRVEPTLTAEGGIAVR